MGIVRISGMVAVPKADMSSGLLDQLRGELTLEPNVSKQFKTAATGPVPAYRESDDWLYLPRAFALKHPDVRQLMAKIGIDDALSYGTAVPFVFNRQMQTQSADRFPVGRQDEWVSALHQALTTPGMENLGCIGQATCGFGKTVLALRLASLLGRTTLVIVHKEFLVSQWTERAKQWLGLQDDEIGLVQQDTCDFQGKKLVLAMVHSLAGRDYGQSLYNWPGVVIADEVHRMAAPEFSKALPKFTSAYRVGLSATPTRKDGLANIFRWAIGPVAAAETEWQVKPRVIVVKYPVSLESRFYKWKGKTMLGRLITRVSKITPYNEWLNTQVVMAVLTKGRTVMVLSDRLEHLSDLKQRFEDTVRGQATSSFYIGGMTAKAREEAAEADAIFATYGFAMEGVDIPAVDTVVLATPRGDIEQAVGRAARICEGKKDPTVLDIIHEGVKECEGMGWSRQRFYEKRDFEIVRHVPVTQP